MLDHGTSIQHGRRLLNAVVDERASSNQPRPYASIPRSFVISAGFRDISYGTLANAVNRCAHWLVLVFGKPGEDNTTAYIGPSDLRCQLLFLDVFPSPRNTEEALEKLFGDAGASKIITPPNPSKVVENIVEQRLMHHIEIRPHEELLDETPVTPIPFIGTFEKYRLQPWVKLYTLGSTGSPKIVIIKHGLVSAVDAYHNLEHNEAAARYGGMRVFIPFPPFHMAGLNYALPVMLWLDSTVIFPPPGAIVTSELVHDIHVHGQVEHSMLAPSLIGVLALNESWRPDFAKMKGLTYSGGPLSAEIAEMISQHTSIISSMGATEYGGIPMLPKSPEDWKCFRFNEDAAGLRLEKTSQPHLYELVFVRESNTISDLIQAIFVTFQDIDEYHKKDCFSKHPSKPGLWKYESRLDDIIVLSNGEKFNPVQMEALISSCPMIKGCLVVGQGKFQTALLVERQNPNSTFVQMSKEQQPFIDRANKLCPQYGRLAHHSIILASANKPLPCAPKGTIQRANAINLYEAEIIECYANLDDLDSSGPGLLIDLSSATKTEESLLAYVRSAMSVADSDLKPTDDFFTHGMDSLQVISLVRMINAKRKKWQSDISPGFVYDHPSAKKLAQALASGSRVKQYSDFDEDDEDDKRTWQSMEDLFQELKSRSNGGRSNRGHTLAALLRSSKPPPLYQPDGGALAWRQVLGSFLVNVTNWGLINSFGAYQAFYQTSYLQHYSPSTISWIGTVQGTLLLVIGVVSGPLFDKGYFRTCLIAASIALVFGLVMLSLSTQYHQIMLTQGVLIGVCAGLLYIPSIALVPIYFTKRRGLALGLATAGGSVGGVIYPIVFRQVQEQVGFGWATRAIALISLLTLSTAALLLKPIGPRSTRQLLDVDAFLDVPYVSFMMAGFFLFAGVLVPYFLTTSFAIEDLDVSQDLSFYMLAILNAAQFFGRILPAFLSDWIGPELLLLGAECLAGVLGFCWIAVGSTPGYLVWIVAFGFVSGMVVTLPPAILPYICPSLAVVGTRLGMLYAVAGIGFLISSPVAFALNDAAHGFLGAQCWIGACCLVAVAFYTTTAVEAWKRRRLYEDNGRRQTYLVRKSGTEKVA